MSVLRRVVLMPVFAALVWGMALLVGCAAAQPEGNDHEAAVSGAEILGVSITVADLDAAVAWYTEVLDAREISRHEHEGESFARLTGQFGAVARSAVLRLGDESIELVEYLTPGGRPFPSDSRPNDRWFQHMAVIVRDMDEAFARLRELGVTFASASPQRLPDWNPNAGGIEAFYFRDPDGHYLEILEFPAGKGEARWQENDRLFLGIDHTAVVVDDTDAAIAFYGEVLGLRVAGASENFGPEQEHLNAVFGARLRITALRGAAGPAIELLEYLTPRDGRALPADSRPADLWHWHVIARTNEIDGLFHSARDAGGRPVSPGPQPHEGEALMLRDPDGHAVLVRSQAGR